MPRGTVSDFQGKFGFDEVLWPKLGRKQIRHFAGRVEHSRSKVKDFITKR